MSMSLPAATMSLPQPHTAIDARILPDVIEAYFAAKAPHIGAQTRKNYRHQLAPWTAFWRDCAEIHNYRLSPDVLEKALEWIRSTYKNANGQSPHPTSVAYCFRRLKGALSWAFKNNCTGNVNAAEWCPMTRRGVSDLYFPTLDDVRLLFRAADDAYRLRDVAVIAWMASTGSRLFETAAALSSDVQFNTPLTNVALGQDHAGYCHLRIVKGDNRGDGGGRYVAFGSKAGLLLKCYLRSAPPGNVRLFGLTDRGASQAVRRVADRAGLPEISPHAFRRLFADHWDDVYRMEHRVVLKKQLGHSLNGSDVTEGHYLNGRNSRKIIESLQQYHVCPLEKIDIDWATFPVHIG